MINDEGGQILLPGYVISCKVSEHEIYRSHSSMGSHSLNSASVEMKSNFYYLHILDFQLSLAQYHVLNILL